MWLTVLGEFDRTGRYIGSKENVPSFSASVDWDLMQLPPPPAFVAASGEWG